MIDRATVQRIMDAADIVDVVSDYVHLVRRGTNFMGLCPFHNERTPSFSVNKQRNFCYCFSCHKGGSPVNFLMEKEGVNYHDALLQLANRYGIKVEERELTEEEKAKISERESMLIANEWAMKKMHDYMLQSDDGQAIGYEYFRERGVTDAAVKAFRLGYSADKGNWLRDAAKREGYDLSILQKLGLIGVSQDGREYDRFRGRVMYPVQNSSGKVVAFGGRDIKGVSPAKYVNSPESEIYRKSNELYGIYQAKNAIVRENRCFLVEGYMDVIGMWQSGMENVVASSGTALTDGQIALIHRFTNRVVLIYDGDAAGIKASLRGIEMLLSNKMEVSVLLLPDGDDPDSFASKHTPEEFRAYVDENAKDVVSFMIQALLPDDNDPVKRSAAIRAIVKTIAHIHDNIERNVYVQRCSEMLNVPEDLVARETAKERRLLVENWRKEKEHARISKEEEARKEIASGYDASTLPSPLKGKKEPKQNNILDSLEREVIRYAMKYGMMDFCDGVDEDGNVSNLTVYDYIYAEIEGDGLIFSNKLYEKTFRMIGMIRQEFAAASVAFDENLKREEEIERRSAYDKIALENSDNISIERAEQKLENELCSKRDEKWESFVVDYAARILESHEDDEIRTLATDMSAQKHVLSKYHYRSGMMEKESSKIDRLVPQAISEWKMGIVRKQLDDAIDLLKNMPNDTDATILLKQQKRINKLAMLLRTLTQAAGERIISPKRIKK